MSSPATSEIESGLPSEHGNRQVAASWSQERLWFIDQLEGGGDAYNIPLVVWLKGKLDRNALTQGLDGLVQRHESLRTVFVNEGGSVQQRVAATGGFALEIHDLARYPESELEARIRAQRLEEAGGRFDLRRGPLIRGRLLRLSDEEHMLLVTMHHIIADGWSLGVFLREFGELYSAFAQRRANELRPLPIQYADYALWQRTELRDETLEQELGYWRTQLGGAPPEITLPTDHARPSAQSYRGGNVRVAFDSGLTADLKALARRQKMTLFMLLSAAWALLLSRLSGQSDLVIGTPVANRERADLEGLIGFFVNTLALRIEVSPEESLPAYLARIRRTTIEAYDHQDVPFEKVVSALRPDRSLSRNPIFQVMLALQNAPTGMLELPGLTIVIEEGTDEPALFDLFLSLEERGGKIVGSISYAADLFERSSIERWIESLKTILADMARGERRRVVDIDFVPQQQRNRVVVEFNATRAFCPQEKAVHELFEEQARRTADAVAVEQGGRTLTYAELNGRANRLARHLVSQGVGPDQVVGICMERGLEMVVGVLGIMKAGGAYLPLDPSYPAERLGQMLEDAAPPIVLTQSGLLGVLLPSAAKVIALDETLPQIEAFQDENIAPSELGLSSESLVYVIYTSGSTGRPKGTAMRHRSVVNLIEWHRRTFGVGEGRRVLQFAALSFDVAFQEIFSTLCTGGELVLIDEWVRRDARALTEVLQRRSVERLFVPPLMLQSLAEYGKSSGEVPASLKDVITAGEQLRASKEIRDFFRRIPGARLHNHYGPTETHVVTALTLEGDPAAWPDLPAIGRPIANTQIYVLDAYRQPAPIGVTGEVYIGGANVARGYLNRPELTEQRFVADPFSNDPQVKLYKTGDLGRWRVDGTLEYLGRNDDQVKIRGYRIELGEVEAQLARHGQVREAAVIAREDVPGEKRLVAYVVPRGEGSVGTEELRVHLKGALPEYMVPSAFVVLEKLPLTPSGKLDRKALPAPDPCAYVRHEYEPPRGQVEEVLAGIWQQLLRVERVGRNDNFFELGGHSLLIVQMLERMRRVGLAAEVRRVFESPTLADLAASLVRGAVEEVSVPPNLIPPDCQKITPEMLPLISLEQEHIDWIVQSVPGGAANVQDIYPLTPLQEGMLFHHSLDLRGHDPYSRSILLCASSFDQVESFVSALQAEIDRHDALRTAFLWERLSQPIQVVYRHAPLSIEMVPENDGVDTRYNAGDSLTVCGNPPLDLRKAPLATLRVQCSPDKKQWQVLLTTHHLACDAVSLRILLAELSEYNSGQFAELPPPVPYRVHVSELLKCARSRDAEAYFRNMLRDVEEPTTPFELLNINGDGTRIQEAREILEPALAERLHVAARKQGVSLGSLFHTAWALVLARMCGRDDVVFGTVLLGRLKSNPTAGRALGMFINTLPLRARLQGESVKSLVKQIQNGLAGLLSHESASLAMAQHCAAIPTSLPLFNSVLNYRQDTGGAVTRGSDVAGLKVVETAGRTNYPIFLSIENQQGGIVLEAEVDREVGPRNILEYMLKAVRSVVDALEASPEISALELQVMPDDELNKVIFEFNDTDTKAANAKLVHELFEEQVERSPDATALVIGDRSFAYTTLNRDANRLAHYLRTKNVRVDQRVGICLSRGYQMVVALLAVLKAGAAYVPLDPSYPIERILSALNDSYPSIVLTQASLVDKVSKSQAEVIALDAHCAELLTQNADNISAAETGVGPHHLAYVIYTSGSTGRPKGVMIEHSALANLLGAMRERPGISPDDRLLAITTIAFDIAVLEIYLPLITGATVVLAGECDISDGLRLIKCLENFDITMMQATPATWRLMIGAGWSGRSGFKALCGGEALSADLAKALLVRVSALWNMYGPTETTVWSCVHPVSAGLGCTEPIGCPISNTRMYILGRHLEPLPLGVRGDIYIGGAGLARGYFDNISLTAERFLADPFRRDGESRIYKTGDLGLWRSDGVIKYLGRSDHQVKLRGFRIELGEIEVRLTEHVFVREAVVELRMCSPGEEALVAYMVPRESGPPPTVQELRSHLGQALPEYMLPQHYVWLGKLPLTPNGKVDRKALPVPIIEEAMRHAEELPNGETEEAVAEVWKELLHLPHIGRNANFFSLGANSLHITASAFRLQRALGLPVLVPNVLRNPTVALLATAIRRAHGMG